jgi:Arm DNA-binding domain
MRLTATEIRRLSLQGDTAEVIVFDDAVPGFGIRLRAGGSRTFVFQYKVGAKQRRLTLGPVTALDLGKARDAAKDMYAKVRLGGDPAGEKAQARLKAHEAFEAVVTDQYLPHKQRELRPQPQRC